MLHETLTWKGIADGVSSPVSPLGMAGHFASSLSSPSIFERRTWSDCTTKTVMLGSSNRSKGTLGLNVWIYQPERRAKRWEWMTRGGRRGRKKRRRRGQQADQLFREPSEVRRATLAPCFLSWPIGEGSVEAMEQESESERGGEPRKVQVKLLGNFSYALGFNWIFNMLFTNDKKIILFYRYF